MPKSGYEAKRLWLETGQLIGLVETIIMLTSEWWIVPAPDDRRRNRVWWRTSSGDC
jgi:hypothetical protein